MSSEQSPFPSMTLLLCERQRWWVCSWWTDWVLVGIPLQCRKVSAAKILMWNLNPISSGLLKANVNVVKTGEFIAMGESLTANYSVVILLCRDLCFSDRMYSLLKTVACWSFKAMCAESLSPLHILFFYSLFPFCCIFYMQNRPFPNTRLNWITELKEAFLHTDVYWFCLWGVGDEGLVLNKDIPSFIWYQYLRRQTSIFLIYI